MGDLCIVLLTSVYMEINMLPSSNIHAGLYKYHYFVVIYFYWIINTPYNVQIYDTEGVAGGGGTLPNLQ